ncbi:hypothetical protein NM208_g9905 [Fusarium decemcellulare]|uniref:Uncharacterized protein n=1 Tax=Fusarium decemcellulare TaxID=57161 RepID=A0ACC1RZY9_9HYPO|nr:hypothetical protein NM208_g9905 [Fusarium decemcellulare]
MPFPRGVQGCWLIWAGFFHGKVDLKSIALVSTLHGTQQPGQDVQTVGDSNINWHIAPAVESTGATCATILSESLSLRLFPVVSYENFRMGPVLAHNTNDPLTREDFDND